MKQGWSAHAMTSVPDTWCVFRASSDWWVSMRMLGASKALLPHEMSRHREGHSLNFHTKFSATWMLAYLPSLGQIHPSSTLCALLHCSGSTLLVRAHQQCGLCRGLHGVTRSFPIFVWPLIWRSGYERKRYLEEGEETMLSRKGISGVTRSPPEIVLAD